MINRLVSKLCVSSTSDVTSTTSVDDPQPLSELVEIEPVDLFKNEPITDDILLQCAEDYDAIDDDLTEINQTINELKTHIDCLYEYLKPQVVTIYNFDNFKATTAVKSVKDKVNSLFYDASIPVNWKISVTWTETNNTVDTVTINFINHFVKMKSIELLNNYFLKVYNNTIYI